MHGPEAPLAQEKKRNLESGPRFSLHIFSSQGATARTLGLSVLRLWDTGSSPSVHLFYRANCAPLSWPSSDSAKGQGGAGPLIWTRGECRRSGADSRQHLRFGMALCSARPWPPKPGRHVVPVRRSNSEFWNCSQAQTVRTLSIRPIISHLWCPQQPGTDLALI